MKGNSFNYKKLLVAFVVLILVSQTSLWLVKLPTDNDQIKPLVERIIPQKPVHNEKPDLNLGSDNFYYEPAWDIIRYLGDNPNEYSLIWEPWLTKAAVHAITATPDYDMFAFGGGYLYDNEIHIYRWNSLTRNYEKVWCSGDGIIDGDILSLAIGDTDNNNFLEIVAGSADGHIYVFEQRHIYDPFTNIENQFELVWTSPFLGPVWKVAIGDLDKDYIKEIIAVSWDKKIHIYEYDEHSGYPFSHEHWISYKEVWNSGSVIDDLILSMGFGDINYNGLPEILVGTRSGKLYLFENNGTVIYINDHPFPLTKDNDYKLIWRTSQFWNPIFNIRVGNTDNTPGDEGVIVIPGYGTLILDYDENNGEFYFTELIIPLESWELGTGEEYEFPLDYYIDSMVNASNVYYVESDVIYEEPITYTYDKDTKTWNPDLAIAIKNTAMAGEPDDYYSHVNSTDTEPAWAILDFGRDEEILGSGTSTSDFAIRILNEPGFTFPVNLANFEISISQDGELFTPVDSSDISRTYTSTVCYVYVNIDNVISSHHWRYVRYIKINVTNGDKYAIDSIRAYRLNKPVSTALSVTLDNFHTNITKILSGEDSIDTMKSIILGTVDGRIYVFRYNETTHNYEMIYDSYMKDNITLGENIWDIYKIGKTSNFPVFYAEPYKGAKLTLPGNNETNMHTFFDLGGTYPHLIVGTKNSMILAFTNNNFETYTYDESKTVSLFDKVNARYLGIDSNLSLTVKFVDLDTSNSYYELVVGYLKEGAVGSVNPLDDDYTTPTAGLELWTVVESGYSTHIDLTTRDGSGRMQAIVLSGEIPPTVDFYDYDSDGDMDMVLSNGRLFLFKNVGSSTYAKFQLIEGYFDDINSKTRGKLLEHPIIVDFDHDGDFDIIVSYYNRSGATYFENEGTLSNPKWVEKHAMFSNSIRETKPVTNFGYNNFTNVVFTELQDESLRTILGSDFLMTAYNPFAGNITVFYPDFNHQSRYLIATYPLVYTLDLALMNSKKYKNYGYHLLDTWDTYRELRGWTLTLEHADLDKDGKGEVIIGDFDNNIYVFEHLVNNTYKRAYRSPDITHNETTDISPYAWEELEGISGNFTRIVWDHVTEIVVDVDTDKDGYEEFIAVADFSIYIFEATDVDDTYTLIWYYNLRETAWNSTFETYDIEGITALAYTYDINKNYRRDFAVAAGNVLFIFEYNGSGFVEIYAGDPPNGQFSLPGNPAYYPDLYINTIAYGLLDDDYYYDLVLGGINTTASCLGIHGFVVVLEFTSSSISMIWQGPADYYKNNPVSIIRVDNQDYDDTREIIVGHSKGIDIWEYDSTNNDFKISETITSDPNHPLIELQNVLSSENIFIYKRGLDMVHLDNGTILVIFGRNTAYGERLYYTKSYDNGTTWTTPSQLVADSDYGSFTVSNEYYPSVTQLENGEIWVTWYAEYTYLSTDYKGIFAYRWDGNAWILYTVYYKLASTAEYDGPAVFEIDSTGDMPVGIAFHLISQSTGKGSIYIRGYNTTTSSWQTLGITETIGRNQEYEINSLDMIRITPGNYLLAFSGYWRNESKIDYDIWVSSVNSTFGFSRPVRVTHSFYHESHPDMALLPTTPNATILIVYESSNGPFGHSIHASYSRDFGLTWSREYYLPSIHPMVKVSCADTYVSYKVYARAGWQQVARIITFEPTVAPFLYGGFIYGFNTKVLYFFPQPNTYTIYGIAFGAKPSSSWALYDIGDVWTFAVGDSDQDNRREIVANYYDYSVTLFELFNSNETYMYHSQIWYSPKSPTKITDISICLLYTSPSPRDRG